MTHKAMARVNALTLGGTGMRSLPAMEKHGKRLDASSRSRRTSRRRPIVHGTLDLRDAFDRHVAGAQMNAALKKPVLHMLMRFPEACLAEGPDTPGPFRGLSERERKKLMLRQAVAFADRCYGGQAVFAGRIDRDEAGELIADVFICPRYEKVTKTGKRSDWVSTTKHGKELVEKHRAAIQTRMRKAKSDLSDPRAVGIAIQEELRDFHREVNGIEVEREPKIGRRPDWRTIDDWKEARRAEEAAQAAKLLQAEAEASSGRAREDEWAASLEAEAARAERSKAEAAAAAAFAERDKAEAYAARLRDQARVDREAADRARAEAARVMAEAERAEKERLTVLEADAAALGAVADALADGSLREGGGGKLVMPDPSLVNAAPGMRSRIFPAVSQIIRLRREAERDRQAAADELAAARADREAAGADRKQARSLLGRVLRWFQRPDLPGPARKAGLELLAEAGLLRPAGRTEGAGAVLSPPQRVQSAPEAPCGFPSSDDGPGLR